MTSIAVSDRDSVRWWQKVIPTDGCWEWTGSKASSGYGIIGTKNGSHWCSFMAHRMSYLLFKGPIPDGADVHHKCGNAGCVNPEHLEAVSRREHLRRHNSMATINEGKTHCVNGHPLSGYNLSPRSGKMGRGRICLKCGAERERKRRMEKSK